MPRKELSLRFRVIDIQAHNYVICATFSSYEHYNLKDNIDGKTRTYNKIIAILLKVHSHTSSEIFRVHNICNRKCHKGVQYIIVYWLITLKI